MRPRGPSQLISFDETPDLADCEPEPLGDSLLFELFIDESSRGAQFSPFGDQNTGADANQRGHFYLRKADIST
jgi:hypothetical protein